jgi:hypothetical protein
VDLVLLEHRVKTLVQVMVLVVVVLVVPVSEHLLAIDLVQVEQDVHLLFTEEHGSLLAVAVEVLGKPETQSQVDKVELAVAAEAVKHVLVLQVLVEV